jgi:hypothetical protein
MQEGESCKTERAFKDKKRRDEAEEENPSLKHARVHIIKSSGPLNCNISVIKNEILCLNKIKVIATTC